MDIEECYRKSLIKKTRIDSELVISLIEMAAIKEQAVKTASISDVNISAYVSLAYDSLREVLEAICISKGYKVLSHACVGELLRELLDDFDYAGFDRLRYIRNGINYYGRGVQFKQGKEIIEKIFSMKKRLVEAYLKPYLK
jgi:hypothetical protein